MINDDEQLEIFHGGNCFELIGKSHYWVSTTDKQAAHFAFAGFKNLFSQSIGQHFTGHTFETSDAVRRSRCRITGRNDLRATGIAWV